MSKEGAARQERVSDERGKTGVQEYIDKLNRMELIQRLSISELKSAIDHTGTDNPMANV
jgi:hypothetical protein